MTTLELDSLFLSLIGDDEDASNETFTDTNRRAFLNRAYREVCRRSWVGFRPAQTFSIVSGEQTWDLQNKLTLTAGYDVQDVVKVLYLNGSTQRRLTMTTYGAILGYRDLLSDDGDYPRLAAFYRDLSTTVKPFLAIYPAAKDTGEDYLYLDILLKFPDLTDAINPLTPFYADDCIAKFAAGYALQSIGSPIATGMLMQAERELLEVKAQSYVETTGDTVAQMAH